MKYCKICGKELKLEHCGYDENTGKKLFEYGYCDIKDYDHGYYKNIFGNWQPRPPMGW